MVYILVHTWQISGGQKGEPMGATASSLAFRQCTMFLLLLKQLTSPFRFGKDMTALPAVVVGSATPSGSMSIHENFIKSSKDITSTFAVTILTSSNPPACCCPSPNFDKTGGVLRRSVWERVYVFNEGNDRVDFVSIGIPK